VVGAGAGVEAGAGAGCGRGVLTGSMPAVGRGAGRAGTGVAVGAGVTLDSAVPSGSGVAAGAVVLAKAAPASRERAASLRSLRRRCERESGSAGAAGAAAAVPAGAATSSSTERLAGNDPSQVSGPPANRSASAAPITAPPTTTDAAQIAVRRTSQPRMPERYPCKRAVRRAAAIYSGFTRVTAI
jgi:hypothetical protein